MIIKKRTNCWKENFISSLKPLALWDFFQEIVMRCDGCVVGVGVAENDREIKTTNCFTTDEKKTFFFFNFLFSQSTFPFVFIQLIRSSPFSFASFVLSLKWWKLFRRIVSIQIAWTFKWEKKDIIPFPRPSPDGNLFCSSYFSQYSFIKRVICSHSWIMIRVNNISSFNFHLPQCTPRCATLPSSKNLEFSLSSRMMVYFYSIFPLSFILPRKRWQMGFPRIELLYDSSTFTEWHSVWRYLKWSLNCEYNRSWKIDWF